jgi:hypothetical protein
MMIIRIGDERRRELEDHLYKLRDAILQDERNRPTVVDAYIAAASNLPHKAFVYAALLALIQQKDRDGGSGIVIEIVHRVVENLQYSLVNDRSIHASKNLIRVLAALVDYGVVASGALSAVLLNLLDECSSGAGGRLRPIDIDLVLEVVLSALPIVVSILR